MNDVADYSLAQHQLQAHRLRVTMARIEVFHALHRAGGRPVSRDGLLLRIVELGGVTCLSTMNRALRDLVRVGLVVADVERGSPSLFRLTETTRPSRRQI
ncbi:hypothetical protein [Bordetella sp. N]|uniref:hypothetical protein n=1 Tax=Bordetella sp. N TaxID=1746199 RepID=UPI00070EAFE2|nr:hypothetical protein [Bordetella sp. N]ALM82355.1 hypothetical protein ASB57_04710 [Bordetella sp. N]